MKTIYVKQLTAEAFREYGEFFDLLRPAGHSVGDLFADRVRFSVPGGLALGFSSYVVHSKEQMLITQAEYHNESSELMLPLDGDVIFHVAPVSKCPVPQLTEAFLIPKGTLVRINPGVWHLESYPVSQDTVHILIALPERTYQRDCYIETYGEEDFVKISME